VCGALLEAEMIHGAKSLQVMLDGGAIDDFSVKSAGNKMGAELFWGSRHT